jgi:hypothetical protein
VWVRVVRGFINRYLLVSGDPLEVGGTYRFRKWAGMGCDPLVRLQAADAGHWGFGAVNRARAGLTIQNPALEDLECLD